MAAEKSTALRFDPIEESRKQWLAHGWDEATDGMNTVISVMRIHQLFLAMVDSALKPFALTFSRYEVLTLLSFTRAGT
ncbi:MarR family transcriptional regulator, partial [Burkholderia multivorans]